MADAEQGTGQPNSDLDNADIMYLWRIPIDRAYVKSVYSIFKVVIAVISVIAFICCASGRSENCDDEYSSTYSYFEFVSISCFLSIMGLWFFFVLTLDRRVCFTRIPWPLAELIYLGVYAIFYLIADIVIAAQSCGKDSNKAAAAFGFFALFAVGGHGFFTFRQFRERPRRSSDNAGKAAPAYDADRNMETY